MIDLSLNHFEMVMQVLAATVPDTEVYAFGSRVTGNAKPHSDLDLVVKGDGIVDKSVMQNCRAAFEESDLPFRVDVVDWGTIKMPFREIVERGMVRIAGRDSGVDGDE